MLTKCFKTFNMNRKKVSIKHYLQQTLHKIILSRKGKLEQIKIENISVITY